MASDSIPLHPLPPPAGTPTLLLEQPGGPAPAPRSGPGTLDAVLVLLVCALAFLLASIPARNSDLWLHLASGRALAAGQFPWGHDPFASTTNRVSWVNPAWLSDGCFYALYELGGGRALVVGKAGLLALVAGLLFLFRRRGTRLLVPALTATLAVVALGSWLLLQPVLFSLLGLALTLYLLERPALVEEPRAARARAQRWLVVPLFALWANLDAWFVLGPVLLGLYVLGELLRRRDRAGRDVLLFLAGLAACLLTPFPLRTFAWPVPLGLSHAEQVLMRDPLGQNLVVSPFSTRFTTLPAFAGPGGWAYCVLLVAGAVSFAWRGTALHPGRLLSWLALAALSIYQARTIPFFAVAAGPVLALNVQESAFLEPLRNAGKQENNIFRSLFIFVKFSCLPVFLSGLLVLAWPGWLQPAPYQARDWDLEPDGSMVRMAQELARWHADGKLSPALGDFTFSPEAANYLTWYCPAEKGFLDARWPLFDGVADDYVWMRRALLEPRASGPDGSLGPLLNVHRLDRILLFDPDDERTARAYECLLRDDREWELLLLEGRAALFGRRDPERPYPALDFKQAAYHPEPDRRAPRTAPPAPQAPDVWAAFRRTRDDRSPDRGEAELLLLTFDGKAEAMRADLEKSWLLAEAAGLAGVGNEGAATAGALAVRLHLTPLLPSPNSTEVVNQPAAMQFAAEFLARRDRGPPEELLLAVRAARRALAAHPEDAAAYLLLGKAYLRLARQTREQGWQNNLYELAVVRRVQTLTALEQAVLLRPDLDEAHDLLAQLYAESGQLDRVLDHLRARLRIAEHRGGPNAAERRAALGADVKNVEALVQRAEAIYDANTQGRTDPSTVLNRARLAERHGLTRKALELLLASHPAIFGKDGTLKQLDLMLEAGRAFEVRAWLQPDYEPVLGPKTYHTLQARAAAACGDYLGADAEWDKLSDPLRQVLIPPSQLLPVRTAIALRAGSAVLARPAPWTGVVGQAGMGYWHAQELGPLAGPTDLIRQEADIEVLRGLLALEWGGVEDARERLQGAIRMWGTEAQAREGAGLDFPARPIAQQVLRRLQDQPRSD